MSKFTEDIKKFNRMYRMLCNDVPTLNIGEPLAQRLANLKSILQKELNEMDAIIAKVSAGGYNEYDVLTDIADLMCDLQVYCASENRKFGIPNDEVLHIIMESNFSKMGADGQPKFDEQGKLQKGPNYWKPEERIFKLLSMRAMGLAEANALLRKTEAEMAAANDRWLEAKEAALRAQEHEARVKAASEHHVDRENMGAALASGFTTGG